MSAPDKHPHLDKTTADGLRYARWAGRFLSALLLMLALRNLFLGELDTFKTIQTVYFIAYGAILNLPFATISDPQWRLAFALLVAFSVLFVFLTIAGVMFAYMAAADRGEKLGVPGFEGTLIFLALMQVPVELFRRKPDMLD